MSGQETFEFSAAIAGVSIGLAASLLLAMLAVVGTWRLFRQASHASEAAARAALSVEELARRVEAPAAQALPPVAQGPEFGLLGQRMDALLGEQSRLHEQIRALQEALAAESSGSLALDALEASVSRLDSTVGQMAASVANLVQLLERQQERR